MPGIEVDEDLVDGVGVRVWVDVRVHDERMKLPIVVDCESLGMLIANLEDARKEYRRLQRLQDRDIDGECFRGKQAQEFDREQMDEWRKLK